MAFAASLTAMAAEAAPTALHRRCAEATRWREHEAKLLQRALRQLRERCKAAAAEGLCQLDFKFCMDWPKTAWIGCRPVVNWGPLSHEGYYHARHGDYDVPSPHRHDIDCMEVYEHLVEKFAVHARKLGFNSVEPHFSVARGAHIRVTWPEPGLEQQPTAANQHAAKRRRLVGNFAVECGVCCERREAQALSPCGHLLCWGCAQRAEEARAQANELNWRCPFCNACVEDSLPLWKP
mmetsp:Transcript_39056/g.90548  ORF Transcript_39056/g.90548 Transcript_39056/m.90548 type:complete len:236 (-) Transcript_39056:75-782(-)